MQALLNAYPPPIREIAGRLRQLLLRAAPALRAKANRGWKSINFHHPQMGYVCGIFPFEDRVDLIFEFGALLPDPDAVLQGDGRQVRYLRFLDPADLHPPTIARLLQAALELPPDHAVRRGLVQSRQSATRAKRTGNQ